MGMVINWHLSRKMANTPIVQCAKVPRRGDTPPPAFQSQNTECEDIAPDLTLPVRILQAIRAGVSIDLHGYETTYM